MLALRCENGRAAVAAVEAPVPAPGEALVRVRLSGLCNTDLEIVRGYASFEGTLGHEFVGEVLRAPGSPELEGRRVVGEINAGCGRCALCRAGDPRHCERRTVLGIHGRDGAHAEMLSLPVVNLLAVPASVPDERAVFAEPLAAACGILERIEVDERTRLAVIGDGKLGLLCAQALRAMERAEVTLVGKHEAKLAVARRRGVETIRLDELPRSAARSFDLVVEASGAPAGFRTALELLRPRGTLVLKSTFHGITELETAPIVVDEISIVGSRCGRFRPALELLERDAVDVESLIHDVLPLSQGVDALERAAAPGVLKVLLRP
jgi:threonine dehydrogenase-like Zn-dependent dehydrogenase